MRQKFYVYVEEGIARYDRLSSAVVLKTRLNAKGIGARIRMRTPMAKKVIVDVKVSSKKATKKSNKDYYFEKAFDEKLEK